MNGMAICAGVEGIELGLRLVEPEYRTICYVEGELYTAAILRARMEEKLLDEAPIWDDIRTFDGRPWRGKVDIITSGFPCQPWSHAGKQEGTEDERWIWPDIARVIGEVRPGLVFLENVPGLFSGGGAPIVFGDLAKIGYNLTWKTLSAADVGANHKRERVWILGWDPNRRYSLPSVGEIHQRENTNTSRISEDVADSNTGWELQQERGKSDIGRWSGNCGEALSNSLCDGFCGILRETRQEQEGAQLREDINREGPRNGGNGPPCGEMANSNIKSKSRLSIGEEEAHPCIGKCGKDVSDSNSAGCQEQCRSKSIREKHPSIECDSWWAVEPNVGRVVDGLPHRVDRLRACGNGVVPLVAAVAYKELMSRIKEKP